VANHPPVGLSTGHFWGHRCGASLLSFFTEIESRREIVPEASLDLLMQMVQKVLDAQRESREDIREIKTRLGRLESEVASLHVFLAEQSVRLDRFSDRLERVERRLEIADT
jgi:predicted nuclease with TOPRIM domain